MSEITEFNFNNNAVACIVINGDPWFKAREVATILGYTNTKKAISDHVDDEDKQRREDMTGVSEPLLDYNARNAIYINEPGLYSLIMRSKMAEAKAFQAVVLLRGAALYQETRRI